MTITKHRRNTDNKTNEHRSLSEGPGKLRKAGRFWTATETCGFDQRRSHNYDGRGGRAATNLIKSRWSLRQPGLPEGKKTTPESRKTERVYPKLWL